MIEKTIEEKARDMGWIPKEEFRGDPEKWRDAETFVERGENYLPIVQASERRLKGDLSKAEQTIATMQTQLAEATESIQALVEHNSKENRERMKASLEATRTQLVAAREAEDHATVQTLSEALDEQKEALAKAEVEPPKKEPKQPTREEQDAAMLASPEWKEWIAENEWYGTDRRRTALAMGIADELKADPEVGKLKGKKFLDAVSAEVEKTLGGPPKRSKVESGGRVNGSEGGGGDEGKSYSDLPQDARIACDADAKRLVGPNKAFKDLASWRQHYANDYFQE